MTRVQRVAPIQVTRVVDDPNVFYLFGGMGLAFSMAHGYCRATGRPAMVLEGEGNFLIGLGGAVCAPSVDAGLVHVVAVNGSYGSSGGQPTVISSPWQVADTAIALGYRGADVVSSTSELRARLASALRPPTCGAWLICAYAPAAEATPPWPDIGPQDCRRRFMA